VEYQCQLFQTMILKKHYIFIVTDKLVQNVSECCNLYKAIVIANCCVCRLLDTFWDMLFFLLLSLLIFATNI